MARQKTFTQDEIEKAKAGLGVLPDLSRNKIDQASALQEMKDQIVILANNKGYSHADIKSALETLGISVPLKAITDLLSSNVKKKSSTPKQAKA